MSATGKAPTAAAVTRSHPLFPAAEANCMGFAARQLKEHPNSLTALSNRSN
jgi:hypothetical protein